MKIALLDPFHTGSHAQWSTGYAARSTHEVRIFSLPGRHWKWRMHGGAVALAEAFLSSGFQADLLLATDMLDLGAFLALTRRQTHNIPTALYFHENQLTYPWSPTDADVALQRDNHYAFINYSSALAADACFFNSPYHKNSFLEALPGFLKGFPDRRGMDNVRRIGEKSQVLDLALDLKGLEVGEQNDRPVLLWNHRWEYDKGPEEFFEGLLELAEEGVEFEVVVLGEGYGRVPEVFAEAKEKLGSRVLHWGYAESKSAYAQWLAKGDVLPVTSRQDFFGGSVVEAMAAGCVPLLPRRLNYPSLIPESAHKTCLYESGNFKNALRHLLQNDTWRDISPSPWVAHFDWTQLAPLYDRRFNELCTPNSN